MSIPKSNTKAALQGPLSDSVPIFDVFQKGLVRGSERLPYDPSKSYAYIEHPTEGWRVYLRSCVFLHPIYEDFDLKHFLALYE